MFVITGTPRSGTKYISKVLGIAHEHCFVPAGPSLPLRNEASWLAVPHISSFPELTVVHQVRNPLDVVNSLVRIGHMDDTISGRGRDPFVRYMYEHCPQARADTPEEAAIRFYIDWNRWASQVSDYTWRVEDLDFDRVERITGIVARTDIPKDTNAKPYRRIKEPNFAQVPAPLWNEFVDYAEELGYEL